MVHAPIGANAVSLRDLRATFRAVGLGALSVSARRDRRAAIGVESMEGRSLLSMVSLASASGGLRGAIEDPDEAVPIRGVEDPNQAVSIRPYEDPNLAMPIHGIEDPNI
jgi:hypothetical protein